MEFQLLPQTVFDEPGPLRSDVVLSLHSREALKLFARRQQGDEDKELKDFAVDNLKKFSKKMNAIWVAAQYNDPFADWYLYQIEQRIENTRKAMADKEAQLGELLEFELLKIQSAHSIKPVDIQLSFANPYSYRAANLIAKYDNLTCAVLNACHVGLMGKQGRDIVIQATAKQIRKLFMMASGWQFSRITRTTYDPASEETRDAEAVMGALPQEFLEGVMRAKIAPDIRAGNDFTLPINGKTGAGYRTVALAQDTDVTPINASLR